MWKYMRAHTHTYARTHAHTHTHTKPSVLKTILTLEFNKQICTLNNTEQECLLHMCVYIMYKRINKTAMAEEVMHKWHTATSLCVFSIRFMRFLRDSVQKCVLNIKLALLTAMCVCWTVFNNSHASVCAHTFPGRIIKVISETFVIEFETDTLNSVHTLTFVGNFSLTEI